MSRTIDEKVVEMRFDNKQFESNAAQSISTLEKLKQSLKLKDASKSFDDLSRSARKCDLSSLERSASSVSNKFSALETVAVGALLSIGNQAVATGTQLLKSLTVDNMIGGWNKYEQKIGSVQTIMNATGKSIDEVNGYLDKLMWFSDETSYGFTDMAAALGQLTSAGGDAETLIPMIMGIANATAFAGKSAAEFSRAIYNLNQSYSAGSLQYMDWRSLELAGIASKQLKELIIETGVELGKIEEGQVTIANFSQTLKDKWADTSVMEAAFGKFAEATEEAYQMVQSGMATTATEAYQILEEKYDGIAIQAAKAAQEAKTFTEVIDATKDAVSSGWMKTFELIVGNYTEAKGFFSQLAEDFYDIFASGASERNDVLFEAMSSSADKFAKSISDLVFELDGLSDAELAAKGYTREQYEAFKEVDRQIKDGTADMRAYVDTISPPSGRENLAQAVFNLRDALFLVDEETEQAIGFIAVFKEAWSEIFPPITSQRIYEITERIRDFTQSLIPSEETADRLKRTFKGLFAVLDIGKQLFSAIFRTIQPFVSEIFGLSDGLLDASSSLGDWLVKLDESIKEHDVFFGGLQMIVGLLKSAATAIKDFAASVGGKLGLPSFDEMKTSLVELFNTIRDKFQNGGSERIWAFFDRLKEMDNFSFENIQAALQDFKDNVLDYFFDFDGKFDGISERLKAGWAQITGFVDRVKELDGFSLDNLQTALDDFRKNIIDYFLNSGGVFTKLRDWFESIREKAKATLDDIVGFADGTKTKAENAFESVIQFFINLKNKLFGTAMEIRNQLADKIGFAEIFSIGLSGAMVAFLKKISDSLEMFSSPLEAIENVLNSLAKNISASAWKKKSEALKNVAESVLILVGALAILTLLDQEKLKSAIGILGILAGGLLAFSAIESIISKIAKNKDMVSMAGNIFALGASLLMIATAMKQLEGLENIGSSFAVITALMGELLIVGKLMQSEKEVFSSSALSILAFGISLKLMVKAIRDIDSMQLDNIQQTILTLLGILGTMALVGKISKNLDRDTGIGLLAIVVSLKIVVSAIEDMAAIDANQMKEALKTFIGIFGMFALMMIASRFAGEHAGEAGSALLKMSVALGIIILVFKMMENLDQNALEQSKRTIEELLLVFGAVTALSYFAGEHASKAGTMLLKMSGALVVLTIVLTALTSLAEYSPEAFSRALRSIEELLVIFGVLVGISAFAGEGEYATGVIVSLTIAIGVLATAVSVLTILDPGKLQNSVLALTILMGAMSLMIAAVNYASKGMQNAGKSIATLGVLTGVVLILAGVLTIMGQLDIKAPMENAAGIGILLGSMAVAMAIMSKVGDVSRSAMGTMGVLTGVVTGLAIILGLMDHFEVTASLENAASLGLLANALSVAMVILSKAGHVSGAAIGATAGMALVVGALGGIIGLLEKYDVAPSIETSAAISILLLGLSSACVILGVAGTFAAAASAGLPILAALVIGTGVLMALISEITKDNPTVEEDLDRAIMVLEKIGEGLGGCIGGIIEGVLGGIGDAFSNIGQHLSDFMEKSQGFFKGARGLDADVVEGVGRLVEIILAITGADIVDSLTSWITGGDSIDQFGEKLNKFEDGLTQTL